MKTTIFLLRRLALMGIVFLQVGASLVSAASNVIFTDSWADAAKYDSIKHIYYVNTKGSFKFNLSLPLNGIDLSEAGANSEFYLSIGNTQIVYDNLGNATNFSSGQPLASFQLTTNDIDGNLITNGVVTVSWTATNITVTGSASADLLGGEAMFSSEGGILGSSTKPFPFTVGYPGYETIISLDASENGGGYFDYDNPYIVANGSDQQTISTPKGSGPLYLESGSMSGSEILTPPRLALTAPAANGRFYGFNPSVDLKGTASDALGVASILCYVNGDTNNATPIDQAAALPAAEISWTAEADLSQVAQLGSNLITVLAVDVAGNQTQVSRTVFWIETNSAVVTVNPTGAGSVKGIKNGQVLELNTSYAVSAAPASATWIFSYWSDASGDVLSSNATFDYVDTSTNASAGFVETGGTLTANFVQNPFNHTGLAGAYSALFYDTNNGLELNDAGYIALTVSETGAYSGKLYLAAGASSFGLSGQLAEAPDGSNAIAELLIERNFTTTERKSNTEYLEVNLLVVTETNPSNPGAGMLEGSVNCFSDPTETNLLESAEIQGGLSLNNTNTLPGLYNIVISPPSADPAQGPGGYSFGGATVNKNGAVALVLNLADGASPVVSFSGFLAKNGVCPFYASLYGGNGVILGWMQFATNGSGNMQPQPIQWVKQAVADTSYTHGFIGASSISGGLYLPPKAGANVFGVGETALTFAVDRGYSGLSLPDEEDFAVTFNPAKNIFADPSKVTIALTPSSGALTGAFPAGGKTPFTYHGVEVDGAGYGFYISTNKETGPIWIGVQN